MATDTYVKVCGRFAYLCVIIDLFARKVIAFRVHLEMDSLFVIQTLQDALDKRKVTDSLLFHSDRGSQYTSANFRQFLDDNNITQSFSKAGHPWDNAVIDY